VEICRFYTRFGAYPNYVIQIEMFVKATFQRKKEKQEKEKNSINRD
jgi:hypothetical protein